MISKSSSLDAIINVLDGENIFDYDLSLILRTLSKASTISDASQVDINHICSRVNNYLLSKRDDFRWIGCKLFVVISLHLRILMSPYLKEMIGSMVKILSSKCFITDYSNPNKEKLATLQSASEALKFAISRIRSKPTLTREVLTPRLPSIIAALIDNIALIPEDAIQTLYNILLYHSTTFRPFGSKFETQLSNLLAGDDNYFSMDPCLVNLCFRCLALLSFSLSREGPEKIWKKKVSNLLLEMRSILSIYHELLETSQDPDFASRMKLLPDDRSESITEKFVFDSLNIDIAENPLDLFKISKRIEALCAFISAYISIPTLTTVRVPLAQFVALGELLTSMNVGYLPIKRDIRDPLTRVFISQSLKQVNRVGIHFIQSLESNFPTEILLHHTSILSTLDSAIPVTISKGKATIDKKAVAEDEELVVDVINASTELISNVGTLSDSSTIDHIVSAALIIVKPQIPDISGMSTGLESAENGGNNGKGSTNFKGNRRNNRKGRKHSNIIGLSDIVAHSELFVLSATESVMHIIRQFFSITLSNCKLSPSKVVKITRFGILDAIKNKEILNNGVANKRNKDIIDLLEALALNPAQRGLPVSVLPIVSTLIGKKDRMLSLLLNPRFPPMSTIVGQITDANLEEINSPEEEDDEELEGQTTKSNMKSSANSNKEAEELERKRKLEENEAVQSLKRARQENEDELRNIAMKKEKERTESKKQAVAEDKAEVETLSAKVEETFVQVDRKTEKVESVGQNVASDSDSDSDIELPPIVVDEDDEDED